MTEMNIYRKIEYFIWKIHKEQQHLIFLDKCRAEDFFPEFSKVDHKTYKKLHLQPHNAKKIENNIFNFENKNILTTLPVTSIVSIIFIMNALNLTLTLIKHFLL